MVYMYIVLFCIVLRTFVSVIDVDLANVTSINTMLGCSLDLDCYGVGTAIQWMKQLSRSELANSTNTIVKVSLSPHTFTE